YPLRSPLFIRETENSTTTSEKEGYKMLYSARKARWKFMEADRGDQGSGNSTPENHPSNTPEHKEEPPSTEEHKEYVTKSELKDSVKEAVKEILPELLPKKEEPKEELPKEEEKDKTPESPKIEVPGIKFLAVRKRGGRIVRRPVKEEKKKEEPKKSA